MRTVIVQIFNSTTELTLPRGIPINKERNSSISCENRN